MSAKEHRGPLTKRCGEYNLTRKVTLPMVDCTSGACSVSETLFFSSRGFGCGAWLERLRLHHCMLESQPPQKRFKSA